MDTREILATLGGGIIVVVVLRALGLDLPLVADIVIFFLGVAGSAFLVRRLKHT
jgi:hypothetical protein